MKAFLALLLFKNYTTLPRIFEIGCSIITWLNILLIISLLL